MLAPVVENRTVRGSARARRRSELANRRRFANFQRQRGPADPRESGFCLLCADTPFTPYLNGLSPSAASYHAPPTPRRLHTHPPSRSTSTHHLPRRCPPDEPLLDARPPDHRGARDSYEGSRQVSGRAARHAINAERVAPAEAAMAAGARWPPRHHLAAAPLSWSRRRLWSSRSSFSGRLFNYALIGTWDLASCLRSRTTELRSRKIGIRVTSPGRPWPTIFTRTRNTSASLHQHTWATTRCA